MLNDQQFEPQPRHEKTNNVVLNRSDTNWSVSPQKKARNFKFWIEKIEELYYPCSENKGTDQLRGYRKADLPLCFSICRLLVFS